MITSYIIHFVFSAVFTVINLVLLPINILIANYLPVLSSALSAVNSLFQSILSTVPFLVSLTMLPTLAIQMIVLYYSFALTLPFSIYFIKLCIKWYNILKP